MNTRNIGIHAFALLGMCGFAASAQAVTFQTVTTDISTDTRWNNDTVYILTKIIFVETGATLTVEPGTIIRGIDNVQAGGVSPGDRPGGIVIGPGGKIIANGTPDRPIIFTSIDDPWVPGGTSTVPASFVNSVGRTLTLGADYGDGTNTGFGGALLDYTGAPYSINRRWSGLILAGRAFVGQNSAPGASMTNPITGSGLISTNVTDADMNGIPDLPGFSIIKSDPVGILAANPSNKPKERSLGGDYIEGLEPISTTDPEYLFGFYGGLDDSDDSGCVRWVSIRYSGFDLEAAKELQGLTPAAIGTGTQLEWVESILSSDDGAEFFGGKNDTRYLFSHYNDDDSFDGDEGHRGVHQFWSVIQADGSSADGTGNADEIIEFDGSEQQFVTTGQKAIPESNIAIYNFTALTNPENDGGEIDGDEGINLTIRGATVDGDDGAGAGVFDFDVDGPSGKGLLTYEDLFYSNTVGLGDTSPSAPGSTATFEASIVMSNSPYTGGGIDQRLKTGSGAYNNAVAATPAGLSYAPYAACQRQNTLTRGWTLLDAAGDNAAVGISRVVTEGAVNNSVATKPAIVFDSPAGSNTNTIYHIYRSSDGCEWVPAGTIKDGSVAAAGALSADADPVAGKLKFNDDGGPALAVGTPVYYYVVAN